MVNSVLTIKFHVAKAMAMEGEGQAVKLVGTLSEFNESQLGCVSSSASYTIVATLLR